jgi:hypothetical protein
VRHESLDLWVFNGGERAMVRYNAGSDGVGYAGRRVERLWTYRAEHAVGRQEALNHGRKAHVSGACRRASLIIRPDA